MALGEVDYGLLGVVGGLVGFVSFFNNLLSQAVCRFYAFTVGAERTAKNIGEGIEECRKWFSTAVFVHTIVPSILIVIGYPLGIWAIENFLTIPCNRIGDCVWVWRFTCASCFISMVSVPFTAMYTAKQEIAELTIYSFVTTTLNACFLYWMVTHPGVWLVKLSLWSVCMGLAPQVIILSRAFCKYPECRLRLRYLISKERFKQITYFAGCRMFGGLSIMAANEGQAILVNKYLGPASNAAMSIGNTVCGHAVTLASSLDGAIYPAITNATGAGDLDRMRRLSYRACTFGALFVLMFAIPLALEVDEVMILWLKNPPAGSGALCICMLAFTALEKITDGHWMSIFALGKIGAYQFAVSWTGLSAVPIAWLFLTFGWGIVGVGFALIIAKIATIIIRLYYGNKLSGLSASYWFMKIFIPVSAVTMVTLFFGFMPRMFFGQSFLRVCITTILCEIIYLPSVWFFVLSPSDRMELQKRLFGMYKKAFKK